MFFVFNKEKIYSYVVAVSTVIILFAVSNIYLGDTKTAQVSTNIVNEIEENKIKNNINNVN